MWSMTSSTGGSFDTSATSAIGSLKQLRTACRYAKEQLSSANTTALTADVPGYRGEIQLTRDDLEDAIRQPLDSFIGFFHDVLQAQRISSGDLAAVASVGGGASIPFVTRTFSEQSGALVISRAAATSDRGGGRGATGRAWAGRCLDRAGADRAGIGERRDDHLRDAGGTRRRAGAGLVGGRRRFRHHADPGRRVRR